MGGRRAKLVLAFALGAAVVCPLARPVEARPAKARASSGRPRLVLQITVDQLRGDLPMRVYDRVGPGGFRYLLDEGTWYDDAHHAHANTETIVGHVTLATGAHPATHGMVANVWLDQASGDLTYNIEDPDYRLLGAIGEPTNALPTDPTKRVAKTAGRSPRAIRTSAFADTLFLASGGRAKVFALSVKDRGAVPMAGHAGKAFWFSTDTGDFVTSSYYYPTPPPWLVAWNRRRLADAYQNQSWNLLADRSTYRMGHADERPFENPTDLGGFGRVFPHPFGNRSSTAYYSLVASSPPGDELTLDFAKTLMIAEQLGKDDVTDYLAVSFSATDYVGHVFDPSSLEAEDNLLRLDRTLAELLRFVDAEVGISDTLIVLAGDHGAPEAPEAMAALGFDVGRLNAESLLTTALDASLRARFGAGNELIKVYFHPYIYLDRELIRAKKLDASAVERVVAAELMKIEGIALAVPSSELRERRVAETAISRRVLNNFYAERSGDVHVVQQPHWYLFQRQGVETVMHGSPWRYDTHVPVVFAGAGVRAQRISRPIETVDIAPTLANRLDTEIPAASAGTPLVEVLGR